MKNVTAIKMIVLSLILPGIDWNPVNIDVYRYREVTMPGIKREFLNAGLLLRLTPCTTDKVSILYFIMPSWCQPVTQRPVIDE
jgi:hypothetical protein